MFSKNFKFLAYIVYLIIYFALTEKERRTDDKLRLIGFLRNPKK